MARLAPICFALVCVAGAAPSGTPRQAIKKVIDDTYRANQKRDVKGATAYMAPGYYLVRLNGQRVSRVDRVKSIAQFFHDAVSFKVSQNSNLVDLSHNAAQTVMTYMLDTMMRLNGVAYRQVSRSREKSWWTYSGGTWKVTHSQILSLEIQNQQGKWTPAPKS
jgi:hypothetical protein